MLLLQTNFSRLTIQENIRVALGSIKGQLLRTVLTSLIIAIGIMALVGILTAIDAIKSSINSNFSSMGANTFTIRNSGLGIRLGKGGKRPKRFERITYQEALAFTKAFQFPGTTAISTLATQVAVAKFKGK